MTTTTRLFVLLAGVTLASASLCPAQTWQPTPAPTVSAEDEPWYRNGEPITFLDASYYQTGAAVHFNRYQMVRSGSYRGVPIYVDSTQDPSNIIYIPVANGLLQPYERRRTGSLAGTTGNRAPSFPTSIAAEGYTDSPTENPMPSRAPQGAPDTEPPLMSTRPIVEAPREPPGTIARPKGINGVWIMYEGQRWFAAGKAVRLEPSFREAGSYRGFPIYRRANDASRIYLPTADGMVAPYSMKAPTRKPKV